MSIDVQIQSLCFGKGPAQFAMAGDGRSMIEQMSIVNNTPHVFATFKDEDIEYDLVITLDTMKVYPTNLPTKEDPTPIGYFDFKEERWVEDFTSASYTVMVMEAKRKIDAIRQIRMIIGSGLKESKDMVESLPQKLMEGCTYEKAVHTAALLETAGCRVDLVPILGPGEVKNDWPDHIPPFWKGEYWRIVESLQRVYTAVRNTKV